MSDGLYSVCDIQFFKSIAEKLLPKLEPERDENGNIIKRSSNGMIISKVQTLDDRCRNADCKKRNKSDCIHR